ncbi:MAG: excinuclease ABC subunit UvrA [Deltaproteobacteria bacterium]|nr:excinuclease ABC subunit UvrA [Deltaproteobacteria bacterium]
MGQLIIRGARQHNLKNLDLALPRHRLVVFTGPSGSGKSSLAFDTIYAEGQRRYVESLSAYARQFLEQLSKPAVDAIEGLSPAIAIEQRALARNPRSTVGTVTEIADYLRLLYARAGVPHCPRCGQRIQAQTVQQIVDRILGLGEGRRVAVLAPLCRSRRGELRNELDRLRRDGFVRVRIDGELCDLGDDIALDRTRPHDLDVVIDRIVVKPAAQIRLTDSVELALKLGQGVLLVDPSSSGEPAPPLLLSERFACVACGLSLPPIEPRMFSFNGPHGACPACGGLGVRMRVDPTRLVPDERRSLRQGALAAWGRRGSLSLCTETARAVEALGVDPDVPWRDLPLAEREALLHGSGGARAAARRRRRTSGTGPYEGIIPRLNQLLDKGALRLHEDDEDPDDSLGEAEIGRFVVTSACDACGGQRLRPEALAVKLGGMNIAELGALPLHRVRDELRRICLGADGAGLGPRERAVVEPLVRAVVERLGFLIDVGLDYLSLDRSAQSLSGGEGQRIRLATQIGSALVGVLYVLDEPSVGLHARDNGRLLEALRRLVDLGNSVLVVEHDRDAIQAADHVVDMGPGAGRHGGRVVAQGSPREIMGDPHSVTGPYLTGAKRVGLARARRRPGRRALRVLGARTNNLQSISAAIPIGLLVAVTGVSGSGKSSLVVDTLLAATRAALYRATGPVGQCDGVAGLEHIDKVVAIDQAPIGRTPRSNAATYTGLFGALRELYAGLPEARARGYRPSRFSFNVKGGRCEACQGDGVLRVEMHFLPDVFVTCEACAGSRYNRETLEVRYRGRSIAETLALSVDEAHAEFEATPRLRDKLEALARVGLGYLTLGQSATTLSGGEAQRVKLARELAKRATGRTLYVLDEPTTGLHFSDVDLLMVALASLRDAGNTVVVIEHNIDVVACCDWVIDLGPGGGEHGGRIVAQGTPEQVATTPGSETGRYIARRMAEEGPPARALTAAPAARAARIAAARAPRPGRSGARRARTPPR